MYTSTQSFQTKYLSTHSWLENEGKLNYHQTGNILIEYSQIRNNTYQTPRKNEKNFLFHLLFNISTGTVPSFRK